jgi:chaperone modulatory protein CbpM
MNIKIEEIVSECKLTPDIIFHCIEEEWVIPSDPDQLLFDEDDVLRIRLISDLKYNLGVNDEAIPVILHLIDQINHIHLKLVKSH